MSPSRRVLYELWPLAASGAAVLVTLAAVFLMLHPRPSRGAAGRAEDSPAAMTAERADLRREPSPESTVVAVLLQGARLRVTSDRGRWVEVETAAGARGYLAAEAVERDSDRDARQRRAKTLLGFAPVFGVVAEDTEIVLAPYPLAARGGRLRKGSVIAIHSVDHSYFAFRDPKWDLAYVGSNQVDLVPPDPHQPAIAPAKVKPLKNLTVIDLAGEPPPEEEPIGEPYGPTSQPVVVAPSEPTSGIIAPPIVVSRVEPAYPEAAREAGIEGTVELEVSIDATGKVTDVEVVRGLPLGLSDAAADAVRRWTYRPARTAAGPVSSRKTIRIRYTLVADGTP